MKLYGYYLLAYDQDWDERSSILFHDREDAWEQGRKRFNSEYHIEVLIDTYTVAEKHSQD